MSIVLLGQPMIVINSYKHAYELLEKRSTIYSDRPHLTMAGDISGWDRILVLLRYGQQFREYRRLMARALGSRKHVEQYIPTVEEQTSRLLVRLLREPMSDLPTQIHKYVLSVCTLPENTHTGEPRSASVHRVWVAFSLTTLPRSAG